MKILYTPTIVNGEQGLPDEINKYGVEFEKGQTTEVADEVMAAKLLTCPYFSEVQAEPKKVVKKHKKVK